MYLTGWPDAMPGLYTLKNHTIVTLLSNKNVCLLITWFVHFPPHFFLHSLLTPQSRLNTLTSSEMLYSLPSSSKPINQPQCLTISATPSLNPTTHSNGHNAHV
ncbi:hypothetical protein BDQ12DRAFT_606750 [Crucibulum laeve]|uniref:Uncharacterized protein n=1 Tax=Crucibulum laeve TaxID=68775 RepID=A0A5C3LXI3_9AGAR|nr:hypothetical protein BDQ12DRAFT_606750 [Crucibulum laeve]